MSVSQSAWLTLAVTPGLNAHLIRHALAQVGSAEAILAAGPQQWAAWGFKDKSHKRLLEPDQARIDASLGWLAQSDRVPRTLLTCDQPAYPALLAEIPDPPLALFVRGDLAVLTKLQLAMVGSRGATPVGLQTARAFARSLSQAGAMITSGLAEGIDTAAHLGALDVAAPTLAVLGCGLDRVYPASNASLAERIVDTGGALVSEFVPGSGPRREHFPRRNRIISGLSLGVLVVEAALRSGSLITARLAAEQGREVFAIPGSIHSPVARGCHQLIRQGAKLIETAQEIIDELGPLVQFAQQAEMELSEGQKTLDQDPEHRKVLQVMGTEPIAIEEICQASGLAVEVVSSILLLLELDGYVSSLAGGRYQRLPK